MRLGLVQLSLIGTACLLLASCARGSTGSSVVPTKSSAAQIDNPGAIPMAKSISPGTFHIPQMVRTAILPSSAMTSARHTQSTVAPLGWTQISGGASWIAASPDGSLWALSNQGRGPDQALWHYQNGAWTNISGAAERITVGPDGTLWALNSAGGIYAYNGSWTGIAGGASDISAAVDGSLYAISIVPGGSFGNGVWHFASGTWTQLPGAATRVAASWDPGTYGVFQPAGVWVINAQGSIYYYSPGVGYSPVSGGAFQLAPTKSGGLFALALAAGSGGGHQLYYNDLGAGTWTAQAGAALNITANAGKIYAVGIDGNIYTSPIKATIAGNRAPLTGPSFGPASAGSPWGPPAVASALNYPVQSGFDGSERTVGIVIDTNVIGSDLSNYLSYFQTPSTNRVLEYELLDGASSSVAGFEATLDVETVAGLAPGANVVIFEIPDLSGQSIIDAYNTIVSNNAASIVSSSFGGCEFQGLSSQSGESIVLQSGANNGIAFVAASGDQGNECFISSGVFQPGVSYPASDPNVIGIGGTETYRPAQFALTSTTAWNDSFGGSPLATGGGVSAAFPIPSYQNGLLGVASTIHRNVPDIAMPANYTAVYWQGQWEWGYGTSWSAPAFAAMLAEIYHFCSATFDSPIFLPYYVAAHAGNNAFIDVTSGSNQYAGTSPFYAAHSGYDNVSGIGVPLGMPFAETICPNRVPVGKLRAPLSLLALATTRGPDGPRAANVVPRLTGLTDTGRRPLAASTRIQLVLLPTASIASDEKTVLSVLTGAGFTIEQTFKNHLVIDARGSSAAVEGLFGTELHNVTEATYGTRYAPVRNATIPASLAPYIGGLTIDNVVTAHVPGR